MKPGRPGNSLSSAVVCGPMRAALTGWLLGVLVLGCATQTVLPSPSATSGPASASPQPTAPPTLHVGGIVVATRFAELQVRAGERLTPGPNPGDAGDFEAGSLGYVLDGPERHAGVDWWQVQSERSYDVGWAPTSIGGSTQLVALDPACPAIETITVDQVIGIGRIRGLVCFGASPLSFDANVICLSGTLDGGAGGASWMDSYRWCQTVGDPALSLLGEPITSSLGADLAANPVTARFHITGHFDDPESSRCWMVPVGVNLDAAGPPDPKAVIACRERFVVTKAVRLE